MQIIKEAWTEHIEEYQLICDSEDCPGHGYWFPCDRTGTVDITKLTDTARVKLEACRRGVVDGERVRFTGVEDFSRDYKHPAIGLCECGQEVELGHFTCSCECGRDCNWNGTLLAPREQWGEETGEHWADVEGRSEEGMIRDLEEGGW